MEKTIKADEQAAVFFWVDPELKQAAKVKMAKENKTMKEVLTEALVEYIEKQ